MANIDILRDFIGRTETGVDEPQSYNVIIGRNENKLAKPITSMTLQEIVNAQPLWVKLFKVASGAAGKYQIIRPTLISVAAECGVDPARKYTPDVQDILCDGLLKRREINRWLAGHITDNQFMLNLAKEWASFPVPYAMKGHKYRVKAGDSYYSGHAGNKALVTVAQVQAVLRQVKGEVVNPAPAPTQPVPAPTPAPTAVARPWNWTKVGVLIAVALAVLGVVLFII